MLNERFPTPEPITVDVELPAGEIRIEASERAETEVELRPLRDNDASREIVERATVRMHDGELTVAVPDRRRIGLRRAEVSLVVRCPDGSAAKVRTAAADVRGIGTFGAVRINDVAGKVNWADIDGDAQVETVSGDIRIERVAGDLDVETVSGDVLLGRVGGRLRLNGVSAAMKVGEAAGSVRADTVSGDLALDSVESGDVVVGSISGDVRVGVKRGSRVAVDAQAVSGSLESEIALADGGPGEEDGPFVDLRARTVSGDLHIVRA